MTGDGATTNYLDDTVIRQRAQLLPSGRIGAIFTGVRIMSASPAVRLNFTLTFPGGLEYYGIYQTGDKPNPAWYRAGGGWPELPRVFRNSSDVFPQYAYGLYTPFGAGDTTIPDLYRGYEETVVPLGTSTVNGLSCAAEPDAVRRQWCVESGFTVNGNLASQGVLVTAPIAVSGKQCLYASHGELQYHTQLDLFLCVQHNVTAQLTCAAQQAASLAIDWVYESDFPESARMMFTHPLAVKVLDANGMPVLTGPDASLNLTVTARSSYDNSSITLCDGLSRTIVKTSGGRWVMSGGVCQIALGILMTITARSTSGLLLSVSTVPFDVIGEGSFSCIC